MCYQWIDLLLYINDIKKRKEIEKGFMFLCLLSMFKKKCMNMCTSAKSKVFPVINK